MNDLSINIKKVLIIFLFLFLALISYFSYFVIVKGEEVANNPRNQRLAAKRNAVLRGTIYDRDGNALTKSIRVDRSTQKREYIGGLAFTHIIGYNSTKYGRTGLEETYDKELMAGSEFSFLDRFKDSHKLKNQVGNSIKLTINSQLQNLAYDKLRSTGKNGAIVAINPKNGEILALASNPSYDANNLEKDWQAITSDSNKPLINRALSGMYPPGSTFKVITTVSGLENLEGLDYKMFNDTGKLTFKGTNYTLKNYGGSATGKINLEKAFYKSVNTYFGNLAMELTNRKLKNTAEKFYFNQKIETEGFFINPSKFPEIASSDITNIAQSGIGQSEILATPMQMALVASTIANDGVMMKPKLVSEIISSEGETLKVIPDEPLGRVTSKEIADKITGYMRKVVTQGTGTAASVSGIEVCGKTGTADHARSITNEAAAHAWFIGFAPQDDPQIAIAIIVEEGGTGGTTAARIAKQIFQGAFK